MNSDSNWLIFPLGAYKQEWRNSVSRFGMRHIAVNKKEALESKVIAVPETYQTIQLQHAKMIKPICPKGYSTVSEILQLWVHPADLINKFKSGSVQCMRSEYIISEGVARQKYGFKKWEGFAMVISANGRFTPMLALFVPDTFKYKDSFSSFDLGLTGQVYYPAVSIYSRKNDHFIDFGHSDFFFTEEHRKSLGDMIQK